MSDPSQLVGSPTGDTYTAAVDAALSGLTEDDYLVAKLDMADQNFVTSRAGVVSAPANSLIFQQSDGTVCVLGDSSHLTGDKISVKQDSSGNVTVNVTNSSGGTVANQTFQNVSDIIIDTPGGGNTITLDPSVAGMVSVFGGPGSTVSGTAANEGAVLVNAPTTTVTEGQPCTLNYQAAVGDGSISQWQIDWGDGSTPTTIQSGALSGSSNYSYTSGDGCYTATVTATDSDGATYSQTAPVAVVPQAPTGPNATLGDG